MDSSSGRSLTSFGGGSDDPSALTSTSEPPDPSKPEGARLIPTAFDFAYTAYLAENAVKLSVPPVFSQAQAVDSASFAGQGASFAVYRRRIPHQKVLKSTVVMDGYSVEIEDSRKLPEVVAYKVALIEFSDMGEAADSSRHAMNAAIMELRLSAHQPILQHPNIVDFLGLAWSANPFNRSQRLPVLIMEFAESGNLKQVQQREFLHIDTRHKLCLDICQGLHHLHSCDIVHGDMKMENVLVFPDHQHRYKAKLSDFGYSKALNAERENLSIGGTRPWKAPETKTPVKTSDAKYTDVYSLALLIWCTFAHGQNIFRLLLDPSKQGDEFYDEVERIKETGELVAWADISVWYLKALTVSSYGKDLQLPQHLLSLQQQFQELNTPLHDALIALNAIEEVLCAIPSALSNSIWPMKQQFFNLVQQSGSYQGMQQAVAVGLSIEPSQRDLCQMIVCLGGKDPSSEKIAVSEDILSLGQPQRSYSWHHWANMDPSIQKFLTKTYIARGEINIQKGILDPREAFFLVALYINGYGVDKDTSRASEWLVRAWRVKHPLATAYGYRIARAISLKFDDPKILVESLKLMALHGSRTALQELAEISKDDCQETKQLIRDVLAGTGADFFFQKEMLHGFTHGMWMKTFGNIPVLLENFSRLNHIADYKINKRGDRILHIAASCGQTEAIEALLDNFSALDVNQLNDRGETPILCACRAGQTQTVLWLASHGANASLKAHNGESPLHWLISFEDEDITTICSVLIQAGADVSAKTTTIITYQSDFPASMVPDRLPQGFPIGWASHCDRPMILKCLLSSTPNPGICNTSWHRADSALGIAASQLRFECLKLMIEAIEQFNIKNGSPPYAGFLVTALLQQACRGSSMFDMIIYHGPGHQQAMESTFGFLLPRANRAASVQGYGGLNQTLLYFAVSLARDELVEYLLSHGEAVMKSGPYYDEEVLRSQDVGAFKITDINRACGTDMRTPLLEAVRWNRPNLVHLLFERGADSTAVSKNPFSGQSSTWTALHVLAYGGLDDTQLVQTLIDHGAPVEGLPQHFHTTESPLLVAVQTDSFRISDCLISHGADINFATISSGHLTLTYPTTILGHVVASNARNSIARIRYLFGTASPKNSIRFVVEPARQWTCLHRAAAAHIDTMFRATDATEEVELDWTDVDWGANREMLNELLGQFGDAKQLDAAEQSSGLTAMHLAVLAGNEAAVNLLIEYGAHSDVPNIVGETAAGLALRIHMEGLAINGESVQLGEKEVAARNKCNDLLNPSTRPIV